MIKIINFLLVLLIFKTSLSKNLWVGEWIAQDKWQSEFLITIESNGNAITDYGNGDSGTWQLTDGNLEIFWKSGKKDYFFSGVMGFQRISKSKTESYTSGLKKKSPN